MADVASFSMQTRQVTERTFTPEEITYRTVHEAEWPERQRQNELRELRAKAEEALRRQRLDAAEIDPTAPQEVRDYYDRLRGR